MQPFERVTPAPARPLRRHLLRAQATTGPEILAAFEGKKLDYWVTGYGTGGTFHGAGKAIKAARPDVNIVLAEPADA